MSKSSQLRALVGALFLAALAPAFGAEPQPPRASVPDDIRAVLQEYRASMEALSVDRLSKVVDPEFLVVEGVGLNFGWADFRDNHIGPEMKDFKSLRYLEPEIVDAQVSGASAHAVVRSKLELVMEKEAVLLNTVTTFVLKRTAKGWRIRALHSSGKRIQPPPGGSTGSTDAGHPPK